jgi:hypothetical protein
MRDPTASFSLSAPGLLIRAPSPPGATRRATLRLAAMVPRARALKATLRLAAMPPPRCLSASRPRVSECRRLVARPLSAPPSVRPLRHHPSPRRRPPHSFLSAAPHHLLPICAGSHREEPPYPGASTTSAVVTHSTVSGAPSTPHAAFLSRYSCA